MKPLKKADSLQDKLSATTESEDIPMTKETNSNKQQAAGNKAGNTNPTRRAFFATMHIGSMQKTGLTEEQYMDPPTIAKFIKETWENSEKGRKAGVVICMSADKVYHAHMGVYDENPTTLQQVSKTLFNCHVELQKATKKKLTDYLRKNPPYDEKGETVLYELGLECIKDAQGKRSIYDEIDDYLAQGMTPSEIMRKGSRFRYYEKVIKSAYMDKRINEVPIIKDMHVEYHFGPAGTGKTKLVADLCKRYGRDKIYLVDDYKTGGFDKYLEFDAPPILFMDEFKGVDLSYGQLLSILDRYTIKQTHSRYSNTFNLWTQVYITSVYPIEELFQIMVDSRLRKTDDMNQLMRRINTIVYHYSEDGENKTFSMSASEYKDYNDMMIRLHKATDGFRKVSPSEVQQVPFETKEGR